MKRKKWIIIPAVIGVFLCCCIFLFRLLTEIPTPEVDKNLYSKLVVEHHDSIITCGKGWLQQNRFGLWEMFTEGSPYERGVVNGKLSKELIEKQEEAFVSQLKELVPSNFYIRFLNQMVRWFNRKIYKYIPEEFLEEIYGVSQSASDKFTFIGPNYYRILNYHAAHDIGHAMQQYHFTACTSFSAWGDKTADSALIIGRNFDFYAGDDFCKDKIICFVKPDKGIPFAFVTWGGMTGVTSGMNLKGLTVTINAAKSNIPFSSKTPVTILAREILQYASNISEAYEIAKKGKIFISESFMIGSEEDGKTAVIEKSPVGIALRMPSGNDIISTNHFIDTAFHKDEKNRENMKKSASLPRYERTRELLNKFGKLNALAAAEILRNRFTTGEKPAGLGNEKTVNQLVAHHSVIFLPEKRIMYVSTFPWQIGCYLAYDLKKVFGDYHGITKKTIIYEAALTIPADSFLYSKEYYKYLNYKRLKKKLSLAIRNKILTGNIILDSLAVNNPDFFESYLLPGSYCEMMKNYRQALYYYQLALTKELPSPEEKEKLDKLVKNCKSKLLR